MTNSQSSDRAALADELLARADKYLNTGSGEYASEIMRDMTKFIASARSSSPYSGAERLWCKACGTVTSDGRCDCNRWGADHEMTREPNFVNYADAMQESAQELQAEVNRLNDLLVPPTLPRDAEREGEAVAWELRTLHDEDEGWSDWDRVSEETARRIDQTGKYGMYRAEFRALYAHPTPLPRHADANRKDAEEFCKGAFGPFVTDVSQYVQIVTELLEHASNRASVSSRDAERETIEAFRLPSRDAIAQVLLDRRGLGFYSDPMEGGQDAYDITLEALAEADAIRALPSIPSREGDQS